MKLKHARLCGHSWSYSHSPFLQETNGSPWNPAGHLHVAVLPVGMHSALGPHGLGLHGSGFSLHPVMVSGMGTYPAMHLHTGFPSLLTSHLVLGPHGLGKHGSGGGVLASIFPQPVMVSGCGEYPDKHVHTGLPRRLTLHSVFGPQGVGSQGSGLGTHL